MLKVALKRLPGVAPVVRKAMDLRHLFQPRLWFLGGAERQSLFQRSNYTEVNRYPALFNILVARLKDVGQPVILSFGCSTGEEVRSIHQILPAAQIKGLDINPANIKRAQQWLDAHPNRLLQFEMAATPDAEPLNHYDAIFCMSVLRYHPLDESWAESCAPWISFDSFDSIITSFVDRLKPGGLLFVSRVQFRIEDATAADQLSLVTPDADLRDGPVYGPDNRRLACKTYEQAIFQKRPSGATSA